MPVDEKLLYEQISTVPSTALALILRKRKLPFSSSNKEQLFQRITEALGNGALDQDDLLNEIRLIEERSSKIIFLREIVNKDILKENRALNELLNQKLPKARSLNLETIRRPDSPTLNYKQITDTEVRIKFSESQIRIVPDMSNIDYANKRIGYTEQVYTNVIVFSVDRRNGNAMLYYDTPWQQHSHVNDAGIPTDGAYYEYYETRFQELFGKNNSENLVGRMNNLLKLDPQICLPRISADTNNVQTKSRFTNKNLFRDPDYLARVKNAKTDIMFDYNAVTFLYDRSDGELLSDINVNVHPLDGQINIPAKRLSSEVDYVISAIRKI